MIDWLFKAQYSALAHVLLGGGCLIVGVIAGYRCALWRTKARVMRFVHNTERAWARATMNQCDVEPPKY